MKKMITTLAFFCFLPSFGWSQIFAPEGLNLPGQWNKWTNPPTYKPVFGSEFQVTNGQVAKIETGTVRWKTTFHIDASGADTTAGTYQFLFTSGPSANPWANKWAGVTVNLNSLQTYTFNSGADNSITVSNGRWYTVLWKDSGYSNTDAIFMETSGDPVSITTVSRSVAIPDPDDSPVITLNLSGSPSPEEKFYIRYSTDNFGSSTLLEATTDGSTASGAIPPQPDGTIVEYYTFSSTLSSGSIGSDPDMVTIQFNNNEGANYSYQVSTGDVTPPTTISDLSFQYKTATSVRIQWTPVTEPNFNTYLVYYSTSAISDTATASRLSKTNVPGLASRTTNSMEIAALSSQTTYYFRIYAKDLAGNVSGTSNEISSTTNHPTLTYHSPRFVADSAYFRENELLGELNGVRYYLTWDEEYLYAGWFTDNLSTNDGSVRFNLVLDMDSGGENGVSTAFSSYSWLTSGQDGFHFPDYAFQFHNPVGEANTSFKKFQSNGMNGWDEGTELFDTYSRVINYEASGGDFAVRIPWEDVGGKPDGQNWDAVFWVNSDADDYILSAAPTGNPTSTETGHLLELETVFHFEGASSLINVSENNQITTLPVELAFFTVSPVANGARLIWETASETNNAGFEVLRNGTSIGFVAGKGTTTDRQSYSFTDASVTGTVTYQLKQIDMDGSVHLSSLLSFTGQVSAFEVMGNYPNPFNPETTIRFTTPEAGLVTVRVFNMIGQEIGTLVNTRLDAGNHSVPFNAKGLSSGLYFYSVSMNGKTITKSMTLMK